MTETTEYTYMETPIGRVLVAWRGCAVTEIRLGTTLASAPPDEAWLHVADADNNVIRELRAFFAGELRVFDVDVVQDGTPFQKQVWQEVASIPYGETRSYGDVAAAIGRSRAVRAVGAANGRNDVPIIVPCHRVIASDGTLHGYAGGLDIKAALLGFEQTGAWEAKLI